MSAELSEAKIQEKLEQASQDTTKKLFNAKLRNTMVSQLPLLENFPLLRKILLDDRLKQGAVAKFINKFAHSENDPAFSGCNRFCNFN